MLDDARLTFEERVADVERYCRFLSALIDDKPVLLFRNADGSMREEPVDLALTHTLKANAFLLLYNLVEATMRKAVDAIKSEISSQGPQLNDLRPQLQRLVTKQLRRDDKAWRTAMQSQAPMSVSIVTAGLEASGFVGGNVHHESIAELGDDFGFSVVTDDVASGGIRLKVVKDRRNGLAHGDLTFLECGRETPIELITSIKREVVAYLGQILDNIEVYLQSKHYLASNEGVAAAIGGQ